MKPITLEVNSYKSEINNVINKCFLENAILMEHKNFEGRETYVFKSKSNNKDTEYLYNKIAYLIEDIIINIYSELLINNKALELLKPINKEKKLEIKNGIIELMNDETYCLKEKQDIRKEIIDVLKENNIFNIDGYLRFKPHKINLFIEKSIETILDDIEIVNEYNEFIDMLQYYVDGQTPTIELLNVIIERDSFKLLDSQNKEIENKSIEELAQEINFDGVSSSDILVSSLIVLAPEKIILHIEDNKEEELLIVLKKIFQHRLTFCYGCNICGFQNIEGKDSD